MNLGNIKKYNLDYLNEISGGDKTFVRQMVQEFLGIYPKTILELKRLKDLKEHTALRLTVHQFAPQLEYMGIAESRKLADEVEQLCKTSGDWFLIGSLLDQLELNAALAVDELTADYA